MSATARPPPRPRGPLPAVLPAFAAAHTYQEIVKSDHAHFKPILSQYTEDEKKVLRRFRQTHRKRVRRWLARAPLSLLPLSTISPFFQEDARQRYETRRAYLADLADNRSRLHQEALLLQQRCEELKAQAKAYQKKKRELEKKKVTYEVILEARRPPDAWPVYHGSAWPSTSTSTGPQRPFQ